MTNGRQTLTVDLTAKGNREAFEKPFRDQMAYVRDTARKNGWGYFPIRTTDDYLSMLKTDMQTGAF